MLELIFKGKIAGFLQCAAHRSRHGLPGALGPLRAFFRQGFFDGQIDNELNCEIDEFYSLADEEAFRVFLQNRYGSLEKLNLAWCSVLYGAPQDYFQRERLLQILGEGGGQKGPAQYLLYGGGDPGPDHGEGGEAL